MKRYSASARVVPAHEQDMSSSGIPHPHGITSGGLGMVITIGGNVFNITDRMQKEPNLFHSFGKSGRKLGFFTMEKSGQNFHRCN